VIHTERCASIINIHQWKAGREMYVYFVQFETQECVVGGQNAEFSAENPEEHTTTIKL
jgi:hypothetical protein